ncbi:hypothetical protein ACQQ9V_01885 [Hornefia butyriciproducens]|uniref:hypothetical protein n=1 Tax=Hornefia butyriciproducens TaxID=2652293 RepID=UPI0012B3D2CC|nr:hypothetical protein [Hornefia butyriciproducens]MCI7327722.1 hypothetical protein [Clostridiales bacterium]MDD6298782.1 hypothetical protein [Hornefia butyriciproducens]MDY5424239.1 hypothetical protein [Hornefia butyriciproducens]MDY5463937.1 hypothetical protein [Hornefia butyriciproducens]
MPFLNEIVLIVNLAIYGAIIYAIVRLCRKKSNIEELLYKILEALRGNSNNGNMTRPD